MIKTVAGCARFATLRRVPNRVPVWRVMGLTMALTAAPLLSVGHPLLAAPAKPHPVKPARHTVAFIADPARSHRSAGPSARSNSTSQAAPAPTPGATAPVQTVADGDVAVVGVSWPEGSIAAGDQFQIRTLSDGTWGDWDTMDRDESHAPDRSGPGAPEGKAADAAKKDATDPYVVGGAQKFEVRALSTPGSAPTPASVEVVDPGTSAADAATTAGPGSAAAAIVKPTINTRAQWGADESLRRGAPSYGRVQVGFVHHTTGSNTYTATQVPAIIRGIYAYHVKTQGWSDIGYNFLVDKFGGIWEGRYGGVDRPVIGAQTLNYNSVSFGASAIGNFVSTGPSSPMLSAFTRLFAWKLGISGIPATGSVVAAGKSFNRISGHRDGFATACPGQKLYDKLPQIRSGAAAILAVPTPKPTPTPPPPPPPNVPAALRRDVSRAGTPSLLVYPGAQSPPSVSGPVSILSAAPPSPISGSRVIGSGWTRLRNAALSPDFSGDGRPDILAQDPESGRLRIYRGNGAGGFSGMTPVGHGWNSIDRMLPAGDRNRDGHNDLLATTGGGALRLYLGNGAGGFAGSREIGSGWGSISSIIPTGDVNEDGIDDVLGVRKSDGRMFLYAGRADGSIFQETPLAGGWGGYTALLGGADLDGDGRPDVLSRASDGTMRSYYGDTAGRLTRFNSWGSGWSGMSQLSAGVDWDGDRIPDLVGVRSSGAMVLYPGTGRRDFDTKIGSFPTVAGADLVRIVGDVDGDGYGDAVARVATNGSLVLVQGGAGGVMKAPKLIGTGGWNAMNLIEPAGDLNRDGVPDVIVRNANGALLLYPLTRSLRFMAPRTIGVGWQGMASVVGAGAFASGLNGDVIALRASDHAVLLYRGDASGKLRWDRVLATGQRDLVQLLGVGDLNGDSTPDFLGRSASGVLWLYAGNGAGGLLPGRQPVRGGGGANHGIG